MLRRLKIIQKTCQTLKNKMTLRSFTFKTNLENGFQSEEMTDDQSDWDDDTVIEMMLSGIKIEDKSLLSKGVTSNNLLEDINRLDQANHFIQRIYLLPTQISNILFILRYSFSFYLINTKRNLK